MGAGPGAGGQVRHLAGAGRVTSGSALRSALPLGPPSALWMWTEMAALTWSSSGPLITTSEPEGAGCPCVPFPRG